MLSNIALSLVLILILIVAGYLIAAFFDLEIQFYMPYLLWLLGLCTFNMFLDKSHVNIYTKKTKTMDEKTETMLPPNAVTEPIGREPITPPQQEEY